MQKDVKSDSKILKRRKFLRSLLIKFYYDEIKETTNCYFRYFLLIYTKEKW